MLYGITDIDLFFDGWWTLFIIVPCFIGLFKEDEKTGNLVGLIVGIILLLCCQGYFNFDILVKLLIPIILIAIGVGFIFKDTINGKVSKEIKKINQNQKQTNEYCATFSGQNINYDNQEFHGADLTAVFGGVKCDLRKAAINEDVVINTQSIFGGIEIYVPDNVQVRVKSTPIFGGVSDKSNHNVAENSHVIYINSTSVFGGVDIK